MADEPTFSPSATIESRGRTLRLWPGVACAVLLWVFRFGVPMVSPGFEGFRVAILGGFVFELAILVWWVGFSRAPALERWGAIPLMILVLATTWSLNHPSLGLMWCVAYGVPILCLVLVAWAWTTRTLPDGRRRLALVATLVLASGPWALVRAEGMGGDHVYDFAWRWSETLEEQLLAATDLSAPSSSAPSQAADPSTADGTWPGFRGPGRDGRVSGLRIDTDWQASPPRELWRRPVGPGWSSFAVHDGRLYTQEQRGEEELVACYDAATGAPVWFHAEPARFFESMGGPGPRATPTWSRGTIFALGATGILNALDARDGARLWSRDLTSELGARVPMWGFSSSPLVTGEQVIVVAAGRLAAFDRDTGVRRWLGPEGGATYSSPQLVTLRGEQQVLLLAAEGAMASAPADGGVIWRSEWPGQPLVQPAVTSDGDLLLSAGEGKGVRRARVARSADGWSVEILWSSNRLKPNFNDFVIHGEHAYGFDGRILAGLRLVDGERAWKGGRYGQGQLLLLAEQGLLLVISEKGELALVRASPDGYEELARAPGLEGKTWNHPALVGDLLLVRNAQEMAAFRLAAEGS